MVTARLYNYITLSICNKLNEISCGHLETISDFLLIRSYYLIYFFVRQGLFLDPFVSPQFMFIEIILLVQSKLVPSTSCLHDAELRRPSASRRQEVLGTIIFEELEKQRCS